MINHSFCWSGLCPVPFLISAASIFFFITLASGCSNEESVQKSSLSAADNGKTLVCGSIAEPVTFNPLWCVDQSSDELISLIFNGLLRYSDRLSLEPDLAESYTISTDGKTFTFQLRKDVKWHDSIPFTADDVVFTYKTIIAGNHVSASQYEFLDSVTKLSTYEVMFCFKGSYATSPHLFVTPVLPFHILKDADLKNNSFNFSPVGTGPFRFSRGEPGDMTVLTANPDYYGGCPYFERLIYRVIPDNSILFFELMRGSIDIMQLRSEQYYTSWGESKSADINRVILRDINAVTILALNCLNSPFSDTNLRQALNLLVNRSQILEGALFNLGSVSAGPYPETHWACNRSLKPAECDPAAAAHFLSNSGYQKNSDGYYEKDGIPLCFSLITNRGNHEKELISMIIRDNLKKSGIRVNVRSENWQDIISDIIPNRKFDCILLGLISNPDPDEIYLYFHSSQINGMNFCGYSSPEVDRLLEEGRVSDQETRKKAYFRIQEILAEDLPAIFLYHPVQIYGINRRIRAELTSADMFYHIERWKLTNRGDQ